jgi:hypothetical protein
MARNSHPLKQIIKKKSLDSLGGTRDGIGVTNSLAVVDPLHISCPLLIIIIFMSSPRILTEAIHEIHA